jgi:hypothetical protein
MKPFATALVALCLALPASAYQAAGQQQAEPPPTEEKAPEPTSVAGKWTVVTSTDQGTMTSILDIKLTEQKVSGSIASDMGTAPIEGEWADGKLGFALTMETSNGPMQLWFAATMKEDGSLAGTIDFGQGTLPWTATRVKN